MITKTLGGLLLAGYATILFSGFDFSSHQRTELSPSMRQSPGGYRTWSFWHSGVSGGK
jgi:hypothetical protein